MKTTTNWQLAALLISGIILTACGGGSAPIEVPTEAQVDLCGNGICDEGETPAACALDCPAEAIIEPAPTPTQEIEPLGYITFVVNVQDFVNLNDSAVTLLQLIDLFESNGVKGDFYLTSPMVQGYVERHPEVVQRLKDTGMTISYHVRPPHPLVPGFQGPLQVAAVNVKQQRIAAYESQRLDLVTGNLDPNAPGGYQYLVELFGTPPVAVSIPDDAIRGFALPYFASIGAKMVVLYQENRTDLAQPLVQQYSMWVRPSDVGVSRWAAPGVESTMAWWEMLDTEFADRYQPLSHLQSALDGWEAERMPFVTVIIDDYNFYRQGPAPWSLIYYQDEARTQPKSPPFDLNAPDPSSMRTEQSRQAVWQAYSELVAWAALNMEVVTSAEIVALAAGE